MIGGKCPLCDSPVSEGRCTVCGMPYKKDEILYHLNENSRDHYGHATEKAKKIMRGKSAVPSGKRAVGKNASKEDIRAYQEKMRQEAVQRMTATKTQVSSAKETARKKNRASYEKKQKKTGRFRIVFWLIALAVIIVPPVVNYVEEKYEEYRYQQQMEELYSNMDQYEEAYLQGWSDETSKGYRLLAGKGRTEVGEDIEPGNYDIYGTSSEDDVTLVIKNGSELAEYDITPEDFLSKVELKEGDVLYFTDYISDYDGIYMEQWLDKK